MHVLELIDSYWAHCDTYYGAAKKKAAASQVRWPMVHFQKSASELPEQYRNEEQKIFLLDPEGNLVSRGADPFTVSRMVENALSKSAARSRTDSTITDDQVPPQSR